LLFDRFVGRLPISLLDLVFEHGLLDVTSLGYTGGVLHEIPVGQSGDQRRETEPDADGRLVRVDDRVVMNVAMIGNTDRLIVGLHLTVENVDRLQPVEELMRIFLALDRLRSAD